MDGCSQKAITLKTGKAVLKAPTDILSEDEETKRKKGGRIALGVALTLLCFALMWFNFLDPAVRAETGTGSPVPGQAESDVGFEVGMELEDFMLTCLDGTQFHLAVMGGKVVFINLWATYCTP